MTMSVEQFKQCSNAVQRYCDLKWRLTDAGTLGSDVSNLIPTDISVYPNDISIKVLSKFQCTGKHGDSVDFTKWHEYLLEEYLALKATNPDTCALTGHKVKKATAAAIASRRHMGIEIEAATSVVLNNVPTYVLASDYAGYRLVKWNDDILAYLDSKCTHVPLLDKLELAIKNVNLFHFTRLFEGADRNDHVNPVDFCSDHRDNFSLVGLMYKFFHPAMSDELLELGKVVTEELVKYKASQGEVLADVCRKQLLLVVAKRPECWVTDAGLKDIASILLQDPESVGPCIERIDKHMQKLIKSREQKAK